ncbi:hypothetical protein JCM16418_584 [Paenibacillus pini JCM 16418]|uniref:Uncharacterized protein n=2 Tax=Paenibacillus TaxID=44249 RepID=W7YWC0_9BACL|nr:hypothetical protein JCM16418_584 [Paenibacillus pini JCM 16418]
MTYASDTKNLNYIIRYIGKEKTISNFTYKFSGNIITASGGNDKKLTPPYQITFDTPAKNYESEDDTVKLKINWNGKEETIEMNSK